MVIVVGANAGAIIVATYLPIFQTFELIE